MKEIEAAFGATIRQLRTEKKLSQEDFADLAEIHRTYVSSIELGKVAVSIAIAKKLADALETPLSDIFRRMERRRSYRRFPRSRSARERYFWRESPAARMYTRVTTTSRKFGIVQNGRPHTTHNF